jgi:hypothetical protein
MTMLRASKIDWRILIAALAYLGVGLAVTASFATWNDEEYTLATTSHGLVYAFGRAITYEQQAPLYFGILAVWRELDSSVWFARLFSLLCATGLFVTLSSIGRRIAPKINPMPFATVAALNPFVAYAAFEIRLYALALLVSALLWIAFDAGFMGEAPNLRARLWFLALAIFGMYVQYFFSFILIGFAAAIAITGRWRTFAAYIAYATGVAIAAIPLALVLRGQVGSDIDTTLPMARLLRSAAVNTIAFIFPFDPSWGVIPYSRVMYLCLLAATIVILVYAKPRMSRRLAGYCGCVVVIGLLYAACALGLSLDLSPRHFVAIFVPLAAAGYALFTSVERPIGRLAFLPTVLLTVAVLFTRYRHLAQSEDWARVAPFLAAHVGVNDVIAIYPPDAEPAFLRAFHGKAHYVPWPRPYSTEQYSATVSNVASDAEARADFAKLAAYDHVWFVNDVECLPTFPQHGCQFVKKAIGEVFHLDARTDFYRATVLELSGFRGDAPQSQEAGQI